ncbi:larval/pupal cuticle protein H1C-like [Condylostylus longicornis]|uniref:larval/pupal cuticle protein H1C-like n=1 Tax=Condylostylus longicornis TaxID=2530218 RepID=UPI00244DEABA|nr:larval/pupal cuticle protein H1C-like [Condylostylus longicornis]
MNKFIVFACLIAVAVAKPGHLEHGLRTISVHSEIPIVKTKLIHEPATVAVHEHTIAKVGEHVESFPTAVSHQSQTILHSAADKITPIVAPAVRTRYEPTIKTYEKQYIEKIPVVESYVAPTVVKSYAAPAIVKSYAAPTLLKTAPLLKSYEPYGATIIRSEPLPQW